jgi:isocitrate dehydrogenase kinase/phosphatase
MFPAVPKKYLFLAAALAWTIAGTMLLVRGVLFFRNSHGYFWPRLTGSLAGGILFYRLMFDSISLKHTRRIESMSNENPWLFSFFNARSYILMAVMITGGITLRRSGILPAEYMSVIYTTMGIPLLFSSFRFYRAFILYLKHTEKNEINPV